MEDGVLWVSNGSDVVASVVAEDSPASRAGIKPGDVLLRIDQKPVHHPADVVESLHASTSGSRLDYVVAAAGAIRAPGCSGRGHSVRHALAVSGARRRRAVHALGRHGRASPAPGEPGDAAFLLAVRRVLRCPDVLVQRPARSSRLGLLLGRRGGDAAPAAALRALRARLPGAARQLGAQRSRAQPAAARLSAGAAARRRQGRDDPARRSTRRYPDERRHPRRQR